MLSPLRPLGTRLRAFANQPVVDRLDTPRTHGPDAVTQQLLRLQYQRLQREGGPLPRPADCGFTVSSQTDEDGILWYLLSLIGEPLRRSVEICAGDGIECSTANLITHHGWHGLLVDGDEANVARGRAHYARSPHTYVSPPVFAHSWVTRDSVNALVESHGFAGEIDVLSIDVDGMDYWLWDALTVLDPRIVIVEYQDILGPDVAWTVPYDDNFYAYDHSTTNGLPNYCGASLRAFDMLGRAKGYRLVATNQLGFNAFFLRNDLAITDLPAIPVESCFGHPKTIEGMRVRGPLARGLDWEEV